MGGGGSGDDAVTAGGAAAAMPFDAVAVAGKEEGVGGAAAGAGGSNGIGTFDGSFNFDANKIMNSLMVGIC